MVTLGSVKVSGELAGAGRRVEAGGKMRSVSLKTAVVQGRALMRRGEAFRVARLVAEGPRAASSSAQRRACALGCMCRK